MTPGPVAEAAFVRFLAMQRADGSVDFEAFCREREELAGELREMHDLWLSAHRAQTAHPSIIERIRERFGDTLDPQISLGPTADGEAARDASGRPEPPARTGSRYTSRGEVARGGMGLILKVWDQDLRRTLAMKLVLDDDRGTKAGQPVDSGILARFLEEAQVTGQLEHPGVVPVHELGVDVDGRPYFTMRMVKGLTLEEVFQLAWKGVDGWNQTRVVGVILKVCEAMAYAHNKGVIHRDLKPQNVMIGRYGETYVMDWGLAKVAGRAERKELPGAPHTLSVVHTDRNEATVHDGAASPHTQAGAVLGTPAYMPIEQARGHLDLIGPESDVYAVGGLLYHLLAGCAPYTESGEVASPSRILSRLLEGPPVPLSRLAPRERAELVAISEKAMARDIGDRYPQMMEMADDLRAYLEGRVVHAFESGAWAEFRKWIVRNRATASALAALILLTLLGALAFGWQQSRRLAEVGEARDLAEANERVATRQSYVANVVAAAASLRANETQEAKRRLERAPESLRGWEWHHLALRADTSVAVLAGHDGRVTTLARATNGELVSGGDDRTIRVWDHEDRQRLEIRALAGGVAALAVSADGRRIAAGTRQDFTIPLFDSADGRPLSILSGHEGPVEALVFLPDGRLLSGSADATVRIWSATGVGRPQVLEGADQPIAAVAVSSDARFVAAGCTDGKVEVWELEGGNPLRTIAAHDAAIRCLAFGDGAFLATASFDGSVRAFDATTGRRLATFLGHVDPVYAIAISPSGTQLVTASHDQTIRVWDRAGGSERAVLLGHEQPVWALCFTSENGFASASSDGTVRRWDLAAPEAVRVDPSGAGTVTSLAATPDGRSIAVGTGLPGSVRIWALTGPSDPMIIEAGDDTVNCVAFSPDGRRVVWGVEEGAVLHISDAATGVLQTSCRGHEASITAVAFSATGRSVVSASADDTARSFDATTGKERFALRGHSLRVSAVACDPTSDRIATGSFDQTVRLWDGTSGNELAVFPDCDGPVRDVAFSPDGLRLVAACDANVRLWDLASQRLIHTLTGHSGPVSSVAFSPDGTRISSASLDKTVRIWDAETGESLLTLRGNAGWVTAAAFSGDGTTVLSGLFDGGLRRWMTR